MSCSVSLSECLLCRRKY